MKQDVIIIGAGSSGMMCAIEAGKRGRSVVVLDRAPRIGEKIRVSGGGNCNFTNLHISHANYISHNPHFCKSALSRFTPGDFIALLEKHGIKYEERQNGQFFCSDGSQEVIAMLKCESEDAGVNIVVDCRISDVTREDHFVVASDHGIFESDSLVIASGGLSYPQIGASGIGHKIAKQFGLKVTAIKPALVPFVFAAEDLQIFGELSGISLDVVVKCNEMEFRGNILFTHRGLSGPAILQISSYWQEGDSIDIDLLPNIDVYEIFSARQLSKSKSEIHSVLAELLPARFARSWCALHAQAKAINRHNEKELRNIAHKIHNWQLKPKSTEGFDTAEATVGGIDTHELSSKTMESKSISGLYFIGEVIDVTGQLGGYNLQWAWASGFAAGQYV
jgi:predicted Rossmann fold flavoprotein